MTGRLKYWFLAVALGTLPVILLGFLSRPTAAAGPWYVAPGGSDANDCQTTVTSCATINAAIGKASPGDTINVAIGTYTASSGNEVVWITQSVTLLGGWDSGFTGQAGLSTVDGQSLRRGLTVTGTLATRVDRFVFQNGRADDGGGVYNNASLTLVRTQVVSNTSYGSVGGGGIYNAGDLTVTMSAISSNDSGVPGVGIYNVGTLKLNNSTVSGNTRMAGIFNGATMTLNNSVVSGNSSVSGGGGILNGGTLTLNSSNVTGNTSSDKGGGIFNNATLTLNNSTVSGNTTSTSGGGIFNAATLTLNNSTVSGNSSNYGGSGIDNAGGTTLQNSILAGNIGPGNSECYGTVGSSGYNLIGALSGCTFTSASGDISGVDPELGPLQDNGGPVPTQALLPGSPAINAGNPGGCFGSNGLLAADERGYPRQGRCDIGAFEVQPLDFSEKSVNQPTALPGQRVFYSIDLKNGSSSNITGVAVTDTLPACTTLPARFSLPKAARATRPA